MKIINKLVGLIDGKKSYIGFAITFIAGGLLFTGKINEESAKIVATIGGFIATVGIRHAIQKIIDGSKK